MNEAAVFDPGTVASLLAAQATAIGGEVRALPANLLGKRPAEGEWSVNEVLGHLIEAERRGFNGRIRQILAADDPQLADWDQEQVAHDRHDDQRDGHALLGEFEEVRADSIELVRGLEPEQLPRAGEHKLVGRITVQDLIHEWVHHDRNHVRQLYAVVQAFAWPNMGNCRRFADFD
jgi:hypothetical protein